MNVQNKECMSSIVYLALGLVLCSFPQLLDRIIRIWRLIMLIWSVESKTVALCKKIKCVFLLQNGSSFAQDLK